MKPHHILTGLFLLSGILFFIPSSRAQKEGIQGEKAAALAIPKFPVTMEMDNKVIELVKPVKEVIEKLIKKDMSGTYDSYVADVKKMGQMKSGKEKNLVINEIFERYYKFFKNIWANAKIDESFYQSRIRHIYPPEIQETILFTEFLHYSMSASTNKNPASAPPPPAPAPVPSNICFDANSLYFPYTYLSTGLIAKGMAMARPAIVHSEALAEFAGLQQSKAVLLSDIKIPGTFPNDAKLLRIKKSYTWKAYATAISLIGFSFASVSNSVDNFSTVDYIRTYAPVIFISSVTRDEPKTIETLVDKNSLLNIRFGIATYADTFAAILAVCMSGSSCYSIHWDICEE